MPERVQEFAMQRHMATHLFPQRMLGKLFEAGSEASEEILQAAKTGVFGLTSQDLLKKTNEA